MRIATRAARDHNAQSRILAAAKALGERFVLDLGERGILQRLQVQRGDVATRAMLEREAVADMLDLVVEATAPAEKPVDNDVPAWPALPEKVIEALVIANYTPTAIRTATVEDLVQVEGIGKRLAVRILKLAKEQQAQES